MKLKLLVKTNKSYSGGSSVNVFQLGCHKLFGHRGEGCCVRGEHTDEWMDVMM